MKSDYPGSNRVERPSVSTAEKHLEAVVADLRGQRLADVVYYPLTTGDDGRCPGEWDFGDWHEPTMGVELLTGSGHRYSAIWNNTFTEYGLEIFPKPMTDFLLVGPGGSVAVPVSDHPRWAGLIGENIVAAEICWDHDPSGAVRVPSAIRLGLRETAVWIAAGRSSDPGSEAGFYLGTDDIMVVFSQEMASQTGIPKHR
ncbi:hypothetical protein [Nocardia sp. NBC_01329]|uniref:hypothetical protein n=1 Tax=Nocardia sp. NBC_01329 TaxID=2903594 RepID=UPI002E15B021|nr:hypothetical protein OG405_27505 [Nocardia sp. NBC_01329]